MSTNTPEIIDLRKLIGIILDSKKMIAATTLVAGTIGASYAMLSTPIYQADSLVQVEDKASGMPSLGDMTAMFEQEGRSSTEIELLKSRMVLGETVEQLGLTNVITPNYMPVMGKGFARLTGEVNNISAEEFTFAEGSYQIDVDGFTYQLSQDGTKILDGQFGQVIEYNGETIVLNYGDTNTANSFTLNKIGKRQAINSLKARLKVSELGKQTGILSVSLTGEDKDRIQEELASITRNYVNQNIARNSQEAKNSLDFLEHHLPTVKEKLTVAENRLNQFRQKNESVDLGLEAKSTLDVLVGIEKQLNELTFKESEISQKFTKSHPSYIALLEKRTTLLNERKKFNAQVQKLPKTQREILRLQRDVEVNQQIYVAMLNQVQELSVVQASTVGNVRIVDDSDVVDDAIKPKKPLIVLASLLFGALFGSGVALVRSIMNRGIRSPEELEQLSIPVYATVPLSKEQEELEKKGEMLLAVTNPSDLTIESLRSLRTSLHFALMEAKNNVLMITGSSPEVGKSFISANLAQVLASGDKSVLVIDCDLRRGTLGNYYPKTQIGLSEYLQGAIILDPKPVNGVVQCIHKGMTPPNPAELLMHKRFSDLIEKVSTDFDYVILDTPPILAVTDPAIIGAFAGTTLMVGRFEKTTLKEVEIAKERFEQNGVVIKGFVLNGIEQKTSSYYGYGYNYEYK